MLSLLVSVTPLLGFATQCRLSVAPSGSCLHGCTLSPELVEAATLPPQISLDSAFDTWREQQREREAMERLREAMARQVNQLAHPDVHLRLIFEGDVRDAVIPGSGTTDALTREAVRVHNLDQSQPLRFSVNGRIIYPGMAISESPLADTENLEVLIMPTEGVAIRRANTAQNSGESWWARAGCASGHRGTATSRATDAAASKHVALRRHVRQLAEAASRVEQPSLSGSWAHWSERVPDQ